VGSLVSTFHLLRQLRPPPPTTTASNTRTSDCSPTRCVADSSANCTTRSRRPMHSRDRCVPTMPDSPPYSNSHAPPSTYIGCCRRRLLELQSTAHCTTTTRCCGLHPTTMTAVALVSPSRTCTETSRTQQGKKGKGSPYSITERSRGDPGSWQSACR